MEDKAKQRALEKYPVLSTELGDLNCLPRIGYIEGYHQAEKDFELTWEDMFDIFHLVNVVLDDYADGKTRKEVGKEVLRRFKEREGK